MQGGLIIDYFEMGWLERFEILVSKLPTLADLVDKYATESEVPWGMVVGSELFDQIHSKNFSELNFPWRGIRLERSLAKGFGSRMEYISIGSGTYGPYLPAGFAFIELRGVKIYSHIVPELFKEIVMLFEMPFAWHIPDPGGPWSWMDAILEAALQRDFSWGGLSSRDHPQQVAVAKSLAALLPRIGHVYDLPVPRERRLPERLGWLNCWSAEVAQHLGFPDAEKDAELLPLCHQLPSGHWIVQLTEDPLDLRRPEHCEAIVRAYWRFDKIGRRSKPAPRKSAKAKPAVVDPGSLHTYLIHQSDDSGNWWQSDYPPIEAASEEEALRIYFCKLSRGRLPRPHETLGRLRKAYDAVALEVGGLPLGDHVQARPRD